MVPCLHQSAAVTRVWITVAFATLLSSSGCGSTTPATPDARSDTDAGVGNGLALAFSVDPAVPGTALPFVTLDSVELWVKDLRVTGDAAPGDDRTRAGFLAISWKAGHQPYPATFPMAPAGVYSKIAFKLENDTGEAFRLTGTFTIGGTSHAYEIQDEEGVSVNVPMNLTLPAGGTATDTLEFHALGVLGVIDWKSASIDPDGTIKLHDNDIAAVRNQLGLAFTAASADGGSTTQ